MHRRQTLANDNSAIPVPATASRTGILKNAGRPSSSQLTSSQHSQNAPATVGRAGSTYGGGVPLGWSGSRGDAGNLRSSYAPGTTARRTSVYAAPNNARRQSAFPGAGGVAATPAAYARSMSTIMKDPRPVKDRAYQKKAREDILEFLEQRGYPMMLTERTLTNPTTKDFQEIFRFIYSAYDGKATAGLNALAKKFEDEVPQLLRSAGYPFASDISKSHLQAIGAQHSWPGMLAMLHWFVVLIKSREEGFSAYTDLHVDVNALDQPGANTRTHHRVEMWADYLSISYNRYLSDEGYDFEPEKERLEGRYRATGESTREIVMRNTEEVEKLKAEYEAVKKEGSQLDKFRNEQKKLDSDIKNMEEYLSRLDKGAQKYAIRCDEFRKRIADLDQQEKAATVERKKLSKVVEEQNLSEVDVQRLTSDRQTLDAKLKTARIEKEEKSRRAYDLEIKRSQAFNIIERLVDEYEAKATKLGLIPEAPKGYEHIDFLQELNGAASNPANMVPDCTSQIKPAIGRLRQDTTAARREEEERALGLEEECTDLRDRITIKYAECEEAETRYRNQMTELNNAKETLSTYTQAAQSELDRLSKQCLDIKTETSGGMLAVDQRLQALRNEYDKRISDVEKLRRDNEAAVVSQLDTLLGYKAYIVGRIEELKAEVGA